MTEDEKLAEEWLDERYLKDMGVRKPCKEAYLAGLEVGKDMASTDLATIAYMQGAERYKLKWHDLRKDLNNVPNDRRYVWTNIGAGYHDDDGWWDDFGRLQNVTAWCEPKFEE